MDTNAEGVRAVAARMNDGIALVCDITDETAVEAALSTLGRTPDLLVNNAGIVRFEYMLDMSVETFRRILDVDLTGAFVMCRAVGRLRDAVMFLASDRAGYVNGHNLVVDGGLIHSVLSQVPRA